MRDEPFPFAHLVDGATWSRLEWSNRLSDELLEGLLGASALKTIVLDDHDGRMGLFQTQLGPQNMRVYVEDGELWGRPADGGVPEQLDARAGFLQADAQAFFRMIAAKNHLELVSPELGQPASVAVAESSGQHTSKMFITLDDHWFDSHGAKAFLERIAKGAQSLVIGTTARRTALPWTLEGLRLPAIHLFEMRDLNSLKVNPDLLFHPAFASSTAEIFRANSGVKVVLYGKSNKLFFCGRHVDVKTEARPFQYLAGVIKMTISGHSEMRAEKFRDEYLGDRFDPDVPRKARHGAKEALKRVLTSEEMAEATKLWRFNDSQDNVVSSGFSKPDIKMFDEE